MEHKFTDKKISSSCVEKNKGIALLVAIFTMGASLAIGLGVMDIALKQAKLVSFGRESMQSFFAADTGLECALYWEFSQGTSIFPVSSRSSVSPVESNCNTGITTNIKSIWNVVSDGTSATTYFTLKFGADDEPCANVRVSKSLDSSTTGTTGVDLIRTEITSRGLNSCDASNKRRVERGVRVAHVINTPFPSSPPIPTPPASPPTPPADIAIGQGNRNGSEFFSGLIDDARVYNRALSAGEIQTLHNVGVSAPPASPPPTPPASPPTPPSSNLVAHLKLDETTGKNANDSTTNNNDGTLVGGPAWSTGRVGGAVDLDGINDYVQVSDSPSLSITGDLTMSVWVNIPSQSGWRTVMCKQSHSTHSTPYCDYGMWRSGSNSTKWHVRIDTKTSDWGTVRYNEWVHLACTFDDSANTVKCYDNGSEVFSNTSTFTTSPANNAFPFKVGSTAAGEYLKGKVDGVRVYNRVLTAGEIQTLFTEGN